MSEPTREQIINALSCKIKIIDYKSECFKISCDRCECNHNIQTKKELCASTIALLTSDSARIAELEADVKRLKEERRWIPIGEKPPTDNGKYFVLVNLTAPEDLGGNQTEIRPMKYHNGEWMIPIISPNWINQFVKREVTHWQPLPQPPEESEGNSEK